MDSSMRGAGLVLRSGGALACRRRILQPAQDGRSAALLGGRRAIVIVQAGLVLLSAEDGR
jgi:hypothetical protein